MEGITSEWLLEKIKNSHKKRIAKEAIRNEVGNTNCEVVIMMGAGDIGEEVVKLEKALSL